MQGCFTYRLPPLRTELQFAINEMTAKGTFFAFAVCRTYDDRAWKVEIKKRNIFSSLHEEYTDYDEAMAAGAAWLQRQVEREPRAH